MSVPSRNSFVSMGISMFPSPSSRKRESRCFPDLRLFFSGADVKCIAYNYSHNSLRVSTVPEMGKSLALSLQNEIPGNQCGVLIA
jgi:hypothetical protein